MTVSWRNATLAVVASLDPTMSFRPNMTSFTDGIRATDPLRWRSWTGMVADLWQAEGVAGGCGHYVSPDPRLVVFLNAADMDLSVTPGFQAIAPSRITFIPAGMPMWSRVRRDQTFRHLDLHFDATRLGALLGDVSLTCPVLIGANAAILTLAGLLAAEVAGEGRHDLYGEGLVQAMLAEVFALRAKDAKGGLTPAQLRRVTDHLSDRLDQRVSVADLAAVAGLSESWFAHAFKQTTGVPPHRWQLRLRVDRARDLLTAGNAPAEVAARTGFADQAHLTRSFRSLTGTTPAAWRRQHGTGV